MRGPGAWKEAPMTTDVQPVGYKRTFPRDVRMGNGKDLELRLMSRADRDEIVRFARALPKQDLLFLRMDITDPQNVDDWISNVDADRSVSILAYEGDHLAGYATLHHNEVLWTRHVGEIRTNVGADYRGIR